MIGGDLLVPSSGEFIDGELFDDGTVLVGGWMRTAAIGTSACGSIEAVVWWTLFAATNAFSFPLAGFSCMS